MSGRVPPEGERHHKIFLVDLTTLTSVTVLSWREATNVDDVKNSGMDGLLVGRSTGRLEHN